MYSQVHLLIGADLEAHRRAGTGAARRAPRLLERQGPHWRTLELVVAWEAGAWDRALSLAAGLELDTSAVADCPAEAIDFGEAMGARPAAAAARLPAGRPPRNALSAHPGCRTRRTTPRGLDAGAATSYAARHTNGRLSRPAGRGGPSAPGAPSIPRRRA